MPEPARFSFVSAPGVPREIGRLPLLSFKLQHGDSAAIDVQGLLDTGATVNVLPYRIGVQLGAVWSDRTALVRLTGNLAHFEARALLLTASIAQFLPVQMAFAWTQTDDVPILLGQVNFFMEFDVCFYRSRSAFDVRPKSTF